VRSAFAHAVLHGVGAEAARAAPGVAAVLTGADIDGEVEPLAPRLDAPGFNRTQWPALPVSRLRFAGEPVALVGARTAAEAIDAGELIHVDCTPLPAVPDVATALAPRAPRLHPEHASNVLFERTERHGDVDAALRGAAIVVRETFTHARCAPAPLEGRGMIASWQGDSLTIWTNSQVPHVLRTTMARALRLSERQVRVIVADTGGAFGQKMYAMPEDLAVAALARRLGSPVKWIETRRENLAAASQARQGEVEVEAGADVFGRLLGLRARIRSDAGAYHIHPLTAALEPLGTASILPGPYRLAHYAVELMAVATNKPPIGAYRGVGMGMGAFVMERTLDLLARRLGMDPAEIRRRNLLGREDYPYSSAGGLVYDSGDHPKALELALELANYERLCHERDEARRRGRLFGVGIACYTEYTGIGAETYRRRGMTEIPGDEAATVLIAADGSVVCHVSFPSQGQGHATTTAQLVADRLGVPIDSVRVDQPDTDTAPAGTGTFASRGAVVQSGAVDHAAASLREALLAAAGRALEASPADLDLRDGRVSVRGMPERGMSVADVAAVAGSAADAGLRVTERFDPPGPTFSGAVHVASVEVDPETGHVSVRDYAVVEDCGPVINPTIVEGQIHGAVAQGLGLALSEQLVYDEHAQLVTGTLMDYALPVAALVPCPRLVHLETPSPLVPGGYKGMGEGGTIGAPAAIANAVADAVAPLGVAITALPIVPEDLIRPRAAAPRSEASQLGGRRS
jgi:carbon-monoxide dehydrogenase large subunit